MESLKIMTLNIHNYHDFEERKPRIIKTIKKYDPDILALQEIRDDESKHPENQASQLNKKLKFDHLRFLPTMDMNKVKRLQGRPMCKEGIALFSKYPFTARAIPLQQHRDDKHTRKILDATVSFHGKRLRVFVVHFSPNDLFARLHAQQTFALARNPQPILLGDFNIKKTQELRPFIKKYGYSSSLSFNYRSYPADNCSYDYIILPKGMKFEKFLCLRERLSDHRALFAKIAV